MFIRYAVCPVFVFKCSLLWSSTFSVEFLLQLPAVTFRSVWFGPDGPRRRRLNGFVKHFDQRCSLVSSLQLNGAFKSAACVETATSERELPFKLEDWCVCVCRAAELMTRTGSVVTLEVAKQGAIYHGLATLLNQPSPLMQRGEHALILQTLSYKFMHLNITINYTFNAQPYPSSFPFLCLFTFHQWHDKLKVRIAKS